MNIQRRISIDEVVAAAALDRVAALAAEDDVAAAKRRLPSRASKPLMRPAVGAAWSAASSPFSTSSELEPDKASTSMKRSRVASVAGMSSRVGIEREVGDDAGLAGGERHPVEALPAEVLIDALAAHENVVTILAVHVVRAGSADQHVVGDDRALRSAGCSLSPNSVSSIGPPLIQSSPSLPNTSSAPPPARIMSLPRPPKASLRGRILAARDEVVAGAAKQEVLSGPAADGVVAVAAPEDVVAGAVRDPVVAGAAHDGIVARTARQHVVALVTPDRVVAAAGLQPVIAGGAAQDHVLIAGELDAVPHGRDQTGWPSGRIVSFDGEVRRREHVEWQMRRIRVAHHHFGERGILQLGEEIETRRALQIVEAIAVLQLLELRLEHESEGGAEQPAIAHLLFGEPADPQIDVIETGIGDAVRIARPRPGAIQEIHAVGAAHHRLPSTIDVAAARFSSKVVAAAMVGWAAVGGNEIDQGLRDA